MSAPRTRVAGPVVLPDGSAIPGNAEIVFTLRDWDRFTTSDGKAVAVEGQIIAPIVDGAIDVTLLRTVSGERGSFYDVAYRYWSVPANAPVSRALGSVSLTGASTVNFADLLLLPAPLPDVPDLLSQVQGTLAEAQALVVNADAVHEDRLAAEAAAATAAADANAQIAPNVAAAEAARDASEAFASAGASAAKYYDTIALGRAAVADGGSFGVIAGGTDGLLYPTLYRRDSSSAQTKLVKQVIQGNLATLRADTARAFAHNLLTDAMLDWRDLGAIFRDAGVTLAREEIGSQPVLAVSTTREDTGNVVRFPPIAAARFKSGVVSIAVEIVSADATSATGNNNVVGLRQTGSNVISTTEASQTVALPAGAIASSTWYRIENMSIDEDAEWVQVHVRRNAAEFRIGRVIVVDGPVASERPADSARALAEIAAQNRLDLDFSTLDMPRLTHSTSATTVFNPLLLLTETGLQVAGANQNDYLVTSSGEFVTGRYCVARATFKKIGTLASGRAILALGPSGPNASGRRQYHYRQDGAVIQIEGDGVTGATALAAGTPSQAFVENDVFGLELARNPDGTGILTVIAPDGGARDYAVTGIPLGPVHVGARNGNVTSGLRFELQRLTVDSSLSAPSVNDDYEERIEALEEALGLQGLKLRGSRVLPTPPALSGRTPAGWTCTGCDVFDTGPLAGFNVVADDGRLVDTGSDPYARRLHVVTPQFGRVVKTLSLGTVTTSSVQGVAIDRGAAPGSIWTAHGNGDDHIRHWQAFTGALDGTDSAATQVTGDAISWSSLSLASNPNGLAFDSDHGNALWVTPITGNKAYQIDLSTKAVIKTVTLGVGGTSGANSPDQIQYLSAAQTSDGKPRLIYSMGANGSNGQVRIYNLADDTDQPWATLPGVQAIEGVFYDPVSHILTAVSDGGFHIAADPAENRVWWFDMPALPA